MNKILLAVLLAPLSAGAQSIVSGGAGGGAIPATVAASTITASVTLRSGSNGFDPALISTNLYSSAANSESPFIAGRSTTSGTGLSTDGFIGFQDRNLIIGNWRYGVGGGAGGSVGASILTLYLASGTYNNPRAWAGPPPGNTALGQYAVRASTGYGTVQLSNINTLVETGATATPGSPAILPTSLVFQTNNQSGSNTTQMTITSSGTVVVSSAIYAGSSAAVQLYRCSGGTFAGNIVYGASGLCTGGTPVAIPVWVP